MPKTSPGAAWAFFVAVACAASACGHRVMEAFAATGLVPSDYAEYPHVSVAPVGLIALAAALAGVAYSIARTDRRGRDVDAAVAARAVLGIGLVPCVAIVLAIQLTVLCLGENVEHLSAERTLCDGLEWLGGPLLTALAVHGLLALVGTSLLRRFLAGILQTCDNLLRAVCSLLLAPRPARNRAAFSRRDRPSHSRSSARLLSRSRGLRAPPPLDLAL